MELKEAIESSRRKIIAAHNVFHGGHHESVLPNVCNSSMKVAENYLVELHNLLHKYFKVPLPEHGINELVDTETPLEGLKDQERAAQNSAENEPIVILSFEEHLKRIEYLADKTLISFQAEKLEDARDNLIHISIHNNQSLQLLDELITMQQHIDDGSEV